MSIFSTANGRPVLVSEVALAEAFENASVHDDEDQGSFAKSLSQDLEHDCYEL